MTFAPENFANYIGAMLESGIRDSESIAIVTAMRFYADENGRVFRTVAEISAASRVSTRTTMDRLAQLVAMQIVERQVASKRGNVYQLMPLKMCASRTSDVRQPQIRSAPAAHQKCEPRTSEVRAPHIRCAPAAHQNHIGSYSGSDVATELQEQEPQKAAAAAAARTHAHEGPVEVAEIPHLAELVAAWWSTQLGQGGRRPGFIVPPAVIGAIRALLDAHGHERLKWAIGAAVAKTNQGAPTLSFLTRLCEGGPLPERPQQARGGSYQGAAYKSVNGVATPAHVPEGEL